MGQSNECAVSVILVALLKLDVAFRYLVQDAFVEPLILILKQAKGVVEELVNLILVLLIQHRKSVCTDKS